MQCICPESVLSYQGSGNQTFSNFDKEKVSHNGIPNTHDLGLFIEGNIFGHVTMVSTQIKDQISSSGFVRKITKTILSNGRKMQINN